MPVAYQSSITHFPAFMSETSASGLAKPTSTAVGDVLVAQIAAFTNSASGPLSIASTGDTWTLVANTVTTNPPTTMELYVWICVVANASSTITISWDGDAIFDGVAIHRFTGVDTSTPQDVTATKNAGTGTSESSAGVASGAVNRHLVLCTGNAGVSRSAWSTPLTEHVDLTVVAMASGTDAAGTDTGTKSNTLGSSSDWCAVLLALRAPVFLGTATPSITLALGASGTIVKVTQAAPSITLSLAPVARITLFAAQATPSITLSLVPAAIWVARTQATPSIRLSMLGIGNPFGTATPSIALSLAATAKGIRIATATPGIRLTLAATVGSTATPRITLALAPRAFQMHMASSAPAIRLAFEVHAIGSYVLAGSTVIELEYNAGGSTLTGSQQITFDESGVSTLTLRMRE